MSERVTVHIEIYLKKGKNSDTHIGYKVEDNDTVILFSPFILNDCLKEFNREGETILFISIFELCERFKLMGKKFIIFLLIFIK